MNNGYPIRSTIIGLTALGMVGFSAQSAGDTITLTEPENFSEGLRTNESGSLGTGSWQSNPDSGQHLVYLQGDQPGPEEGGQKSYETAGENPRLLFPDSAGPEDNVTIEDLVSISYDTKTEGPNDWFVDIFTRNEDGDFGGPNFDLVAGESVNREVDNGFIRHSFSDAGGEVFQDSDLRDGGGRTDYTLSELKEQFGEESILYVALGTATNYENFDGLVDNFQFSYTDMNDNIIERQIDLEPQQQAVPVPAMWPLAAFGFAAVFGLAGYRRRDV